MAINVSDSIKAAQAEAEERKSNSYNTAKMKDKITNYKNRAVEGITDFTSAVSDYLSGLGLMLSDTDAYSIYLHVMFLQDNNDDTATYYYYLSKVNKKDKTKIYYFRDNITPKDAANINPTKKTCWIYQANLNTDAKDDYTYISGLKEFLGLKYVTEAEVNTSINVGLTFSPSANKHIGKHPYFYFTISKSQELLGTTTSASADYTDLDTCLGDVQKRCKKILDLIIKLENHRAKLVSVATNAVDVGESFGRKTIKLEDSFVDANGDTLIIYVAEFLVTRELDISNTGAPYVVNSTNSLTTTVTVQNIQETNIEIKSGETFPNFLYQRFASSLTNDVVDGVIKEVEESASGGLLDSIISSKLASSLDKALSSYVTKQIEIAKASALASMTSSIDKFQLSKAESNTLSDKVMSTAIDYASGGNVVNVTAYLIKTFTAMKEEGNSEYKDVEILLDATFARKLYSYKGWYIGHIQYEDVTFIVTKDTTCSYLYQIESEGLTLIKTISTDNVEFLKVSDSKAFLFVSYESTSECIYLYNGTVVIKKIKTIGNKNVFDMSDIKVLKDDVSYISIVMKCQTISSDGGYVYMFSNIDLASIENTMLVVPVNTSYLLNGTNTILETYMEKTKAQALNYFSINSEFDISADGGILISENKCIIGVKHKEVSFIYNIIITISDLIIYIGDMMNERTPITKIPYVESAVVLNDTIGNIYKKLTFNYKLNKNIIVNDKSYSYYNDTFAVIDTPVEDKEGYILYDVKTDADFIYYRNGKKEFNYIMLNIDSKTFLLGEPCEENLLNGIYNTVNSAEITKAIESFNDVKTDVDSTLSDATNKIDSLLGDKLTPTTTSTTTSASSKVTEVAATKSITVNLTVFGKSDKIITLPKIQVSTMVGFRTELQRHIALFQKIYDKCKDKEIKMETLNKSNRKYFIKNYHMSK